MATNLAIDDRLIEEVKRLGRFKTKKAAVTAALDEFIQHRRQLRILKLEDSVDFAAGYDHRSARRLR